MGVWAIENTREAIWDAMKRKETFATTGPRMKVRLFGGYDFSAKDVEGDVAMAGYGRGVPMGSQLAAAPEGKAPSLLVAAMKDPEGANLDRIQIVKGWVDSSGTAHEKIYNVAWSGDREVDSAGKLPAVGNTVNLKTAEYENTIGASELSGVFIDPDFDAADSAVYYARVLEIPTPRWTLYDKVRFDLKDMDSDVPLVHQERAFSSPIWYGADA